MREFEITNYAAARSYADTIKQIADNIMDIFNDINRTMTDLYGNNWGSTGADTAHQRYDEIRSNYDVFYEKVVEMNTYIHSSVDSYEQQDAAQSANIAGV